MNIFKVLYYFWIRHKFLKLDGRHLPKHDNVLYGKWIVKYPDGVTSKPSFWDVAYLRALEEPGSMILYIGPGAEYVSFLDSWKSPPLKQ